MGSTQTIVWIDQEVFKDKNIDIYNDIFNNSSIHCDRYQTINEGIHRLKELNNNLQFNNIIILISGKLYMDFYYKFKNIEKEIKFSPNIIIFLSQKELFIQTLKINNLYYNNNEFLNHKSITNDIQFLNDLIKNNQVPKEEKEVTFETIENYGQLIIPNYISYFFEDVSFSEIFYFNEYLNKIMGNKSIVKEMNNNNFIKISICKYWLRSYTMESDFYKNLNKDLRNNNNIYAYSPFIKLCYEGLRQGYLKPADKITLYRGSKISIEEFN